ncbi:hypothetical protein OC844_003956 [Tilletia horrida]|nr:hypothetical protein OC844_003956 [Tilletia horrida]
MVKDRFATWKQVKPSVFDVSGAERDIIVLYGFVFDGCLDVDNLKQSWQRLCQTWPILSARLRKGEKSKNPADWRYLLPPDAELQRTIEQDMRGPAARRSLVVEEKEGKVQDHYQFVPSHELPQDRPTVLPCARMVDMKAKTRSKTTLMFASNAPLTIHHLFKEDRPVVTTKITRFSDATAIGIAIPHLLCDGPGASEVMKAWAAIANGEEDAVQPLPSFGSDCFASLAPGGAQAIAEAAAQLQAGQKKIPAPPGWHAYTLRQALSLGIRFAIDVLWTRPESTMEKREIFFPSAYLANIKAEVTAELEETASTGKAEFVSTSDIVVAIALKSMCALDARGPKDKRKISFYYPANLRMHQNVRNCLTLPEPYLHNGAFGISLPEQPVGQLVHGLSIAELALQVRRAIERETKPDAFRRGLIWRLANSHKLLLFWRPSSLWIAGTNWRAMRLFDISFAKALDSSTLQQPLSTGRPIKIWNQTIIDAPLRNSFGLVADDPADGIWRSLPCRRPHHHVVLEYLGQNYAYAIATPGTVPPPPPAGRGYGLAVGLWTMQQVASLSTNQYYITAQTSGLSCRTSLVNVILRKALRLDSRARLEHSTGKITTMISADCTRIDMASGLFHVAWIGPCQIALAIGLLIHDMGVSALVDLGVLLLGTLVQAVIVARMIKACRAAVRLTDRRVRLMQEVFTGIRVLVLFEWRNTPFAEPVANMRREELLFLRKLALLRAMTFSVVYFLPVLAAVLSVITYTLLGHGLNPAIIFSSLQYLSELEDDYDENNKDYDIDVHGSFTGESVGGPCPPMIKMRRQLG